MELAITLPGRAKAGYELARSGEFLDAVVAPVGDIHIAMGVYSYAPGEVKLAILRAGLTPLQEMRTIGRKLLDALIVLVHNVHMIVSVDGNASGTIEFASAAAEGTPFAQKCA